MGILSLEPSSPDAPFAFLEERVSARGRAHWQWKYRLKEGGGRAFYHAAADGVIGGFIGLLPTRLHTGDAAVRAAWFVDWATAPGERSVGAGVGLLRHAQAQTDILLTLQGSVDTQQILPKLRWSAVETPATWKLLLTARALADRPWVRERPWLRPLALAAAAAARVYFRVRRPAACGFELREVDRFPETYDAVWDERCREFAPVMERTSAELNFMCADYPTGGYRCFLIVADVDRATEATMAGSIERHRHPPDAAADRALGRAVGHVILRLDRRDGLTRGRIIDALWPRGRAGLADWLVAEAAWRLQEAGADYIECTASAPDLERALEHCHFRRRAAVPIWYHRLPAGVPSPSGWFITYLDCDRAYR